MVKDENPAGWMRRIWSRIRQAGRSSSRVDSRDEEGNTPLHSAVFEGHLERISVLLNEGAPVNARNSQGLTAFCFATGPDASKSAERLIQHGADPHTRDNRAGRPCTMRHVRMLI